MIFNGRRTRVRLYRAIIAILLFTLTAICGCTMFSTFTQATREIVADARPDHMEIRKTIGVTILGFKTLTAESRVEELFQKLLIPEIRSVCPDIILITPADEGKYQVLHSPPRHASGQINNYQLILQGRQLGMNAIITGDPIDISEEVEEKGMLWFKSTRNYVRIRIPLDMYDTSTGARLLSQIFIRKVEVDADSLSHIRAQQWQSDRILKNEMIDMANEIADKICNAVAVQQWKGYITGVTGNQVTISSGRNVGLKSGDILEVYNGQNIIEGAEGQVFFLVGDKIGEVKISTISANQANAIIISGHDITPSSVVIHKE